MKEVNKTSQSQTQSVIQRFFSRLEELKSLKSVNLKEVLRLMSTSRESSVLGALLPVLLVQTKNYGPRANATNGKWSNIQPIYREVSQRSNQLNATHSSSILKQ